MLCRQAAKLRVWRSVCCTGPTPSQAQRLLLLRRLLPCLLLLLPLDIIGLLLPPHLWGVRPPARRG